eukprot:Polyplicarium_translucidae@DN444_c0_g1_i1.p1
MYPLREEESSETDSIVPYSSGEETPSSPPSLTSHSLSQALATGTDASVDSEDIPAWRIDEEGRALAAGFEISHTGEGAARSERTARYRHQLLIDAMRESQCDVADHVSANGDVLEEHLREVRRELDDVDKDLDRSMRTIAREFNRLMNESVKRGSSRSIVYPVDLAGLLAPWRLGSPHYPQTPLVNVYPATTIRQTFPIFGAAPPHAALPLEAVIPLEEKKPETSPEPQGACPKLLACEPSTVGSEEDLAPRKQPPDPTYSRDLLDRMRRRRERISVDLSSSGEEEE